MAKKKQEMPTYMLVLRKPILVDPDKLKTSIHELFEEKPTIETAGDTETLILTADFGVAKVSITCLTFPYPESLANEILAVCHFPKEQKDQFFEGTAHSLVTVSTKYKDVPTDLLFQYSYDVVAALYKLHGDDLIGVVHEAAQTAHPATLLTKYIKERGESDGTTFSFTAWMMWTGALVKYIHPDKEHIWFATKGNHRFNFPEFAFKGKYNEGNDIMFLFFQIFSYMVLYKAEIKAGHTMEASGKNLRFEKPDEYKEFITGIHGTLVITIL